MAADGTFAWTLDVQNVENLTMAHIHWGNSTTNGPIVVDLVPTASEMATNSSGLMMLVDPVSGNQKFK